MEKYLYRFLIISIILSLSGCASVFAPKEETLHKINNISPGMTRSSVEELLGKPAVDIRPAFGSKASRKCEYHYVERESIDSQAGYMETLGNKMTGIQGRTIIVYYDTNSKVLNVERPVAKVNRR